MGWTYWSVICCVNFKSTGAIRLQSRWISTRSFKSSWKEGQAMDAQDKDWDAQNWNAPSKSASVSLQLITMMNHCCINRCRCLSFSMFMPSRNLSCCTHIHAVITPPLFWWSKCLNWHTHQLVCNVILHCSASVRHRAICRTSQQITIDPSYALVKRRQKPYRIPRQNNEKLYQVN